MKAAKQLSNPPDPLEGHLDPSKLVPAPVKTLIMPAPQGLSRTAAQTIGLTMSVDSFVDESRTYRIWVSHIPALP